MKKKANILSIDVESWVHKHFLDYDSPTKKKMDNNYIQNAALETLKILENNNIKTTLFIVGEIFEWYPELINKIKEMGHEIGYHTYTHSRFFSKEDLLDELNKGKQFIEEFDIKGFRAPEAVIRKEHLTILKDYGFTYDSSIYSEFKVFEPIGGLLELPISTYPLYKTKKNIEYPRNLTLSLIVKEIPFGSGYFIGILGPNIQWFIKRANKKGIPASLVIHTWQIKKPPKEKTVNKDSFLNKVMMIPYTVNRRDVFGILCNNFNFIPMIKYINDYYFR